MTPILEDSSNPSTPAISISVSSKGLVFKTEPEYQHSASEVKYPEKSIKPLIVLPLKLPGWLNFLFY